MTTRDRKGDATGAGRVHAKGQATRRVMRTNRAPASNAPNAPCNTPPRTGRKPQAPDPGSTAVVSLPTFLLRKLYKRGSLCETADGAFTFRLQNPLGTATIVGPPHLVVNGIAYDPDEVEAVGSDLDLAGISPTTPFEFRKGEEMELLLPGRLLRGGNRIHVTVETEEFGELDFLVEDREATFCDVSFGEEE
jgi:hypothetical protein